jgi:L-malate glycosyltransferase
MIRIAQIIDSMGLGGAQKLLVTLAEHINRQEIELTIVELDTVGDHAADFNRQLREMNIRVVQFPGQGILNGRRLWQVYRFLRQEQFDILHTHLTYANFIGVFAGWLAGTPAVSSLHNVQRHARLIVRDTLEDFALRRLAKRVIAVGHIVAQVNQSLYDNIELDVIPNAVSPVPPLTAEARRAKRREMSGGDETRPLLLAVGRLTAQKGYHDMVEAMRLVHQRAPHALLLIAGAGDQAEAIAQQAQEAGLGQALQLLGARNDVPALMAASDVFVSSSHWEGLPIALLEAMSAGLPVVSTAVGDVPQVLLPGTGHMTPANDPPALAEAILHLLDNPAERQAMGRSAHTHVMAAYGPQLWTERLVELYKEVIGKK